MPINYCDPCMQKFINLEFGVHRHKFGFEPDKIDVQTNCSRCGNLTIPKVLLRKETPELTGIKCLVFSGIALIFAINLFK